ncbi:hypothetical protein HY639_06160 [Candidatus Woesearchaeota archaeon]|nr:hypothetical protein [Candidatus Woesearchaeota archaeon]
MALEQQIHQHFSRLHESIKRFEQKPATGQYDLTITGDSLVLQRGKRRLDLAMYCAKGYRLRPSFQFGCDHQAREVIFAKQRLFSCSFLLILFHELGHSYQRRDWEATLQLAARGEYHKLLRPKSDYAIWRVERLSTLQAMRERDAWAYGLSQLHRLHQDGFDVLGGLRMRAVIRYVNQCLATHEFVSKLQPLYILGGPALVQQYIPAYLHNGTVDVRRKKILIHI